VTFDTTVELIEIASPKNLGTMRRIPAVPRRQTETRARSDSLGFSGATAGGSLSPPLLATQAAVTGGLLQKNQHVSDVLSRARESNEAERWDDDFAFDVTIPSIKRELSAAVVDLTLQHVKVLKTRLRRASPSMIPTTRLCGPGFPLARRSRPLA
jgi:hypothetical protein